MINLELLLTLLLFYYIVGYFAAIFVSLGAVKNFKDVIFMILISFIIAPIAIFKALE